MLSKSFNSKRVFKEKIVQLYISVIKKEESCESNQNFWNEFFLLKANGNALDLELKKLENNSETKAVLNHLFSRCLVAIRDANQLRILNGLITLSSLSNYALHSLKLSGDEQIDLLIGHENFSSTFEEFVDTICDLLFSYNINNGVKDVVLKLLLIIASADLDVNRNAFMDHLMSDQLFDALVHLLNSQSAAHEGSCRTLLLLVLFLNYKKRSINNPYVMKLSLSDEVILSEYTQVIFNELVDFNKKFERICTDSSRGGGLFSTLSSMVGIIFPDEGSVDIPAVIGKKTSLQGITTALLAFYEAVLLNRNFILLLTSSLPGAFSLSSSLLTSTISPNSTDQILDAYADLTSGAIDHGQPANLLVAFLEFTSIIMLDKKDERTLQITRLCFIILTCIAEDACANSAIHDVNLSFTVDLHLMPMRHRKVSSGRAKGSRPLAHTILDLMIEFILSHLNRSLQADLYLLCLGILQRLLGFQRRCRVRLEYPWKELWSALTALLKYITGNEAYLLKRGVDIYALSGAVISLVNLFILSGDTFLASTSFYDELYYEIIRNYAVFDGLNSLALKQLTSKMTTSTDPNNVNNISHLKESATRLSSNLINVKAIAAHFSSKLESYSTAKQIVTLSEGQVLEVIAAHYDSLTLKMTADSSLEAFEVLYDPARQEEVECQQRLLASIIEPQTLASNLLTVVGLDEQQVLVAAIQQQQQSFSSLSVASSPTKNAAVEINNSLEMSETAAVASAE